LHEVYRGLFESSQIASVDTDDGPGFFSSLKSYMNRAEVEAGRLGWELASLITDTDAYNSQDTSFYKDTAYPKGPIGTV